MSESAQPSADAPAPNRVDWRQLCDRLIKRLNSKAGWKQLIVAGLALLCLMRGVELWLRVSERAAADNRDAARAAESEFADDLSERRSMRDLIAETLVKTKANAANLSRSRKAIFEGGLALSEEKRILEKEWDILTTYLVVDPEMDKIFVMHGDSAFETWPLDHARATAVGKETRALPKFATIISKEKFAHPERGKSDVVGGKLDWDPPQVGTSARARALGEDVLFTREGLIIHGPPLDKAEHDAYPHLCLTLPLATARHIYARSFIGTRIYFKSDAKSPSANANLPNASRR